jgi:hypothetical protein
MKTKNVKVRVKDIKQGIRVFVAHPFYGIVENKISSKPYLSAITNSLFAKAMSEYGERSFSLSDAGITPGESYNDRRTFFKRKHAQEWVNKMKTDKNVLLRHAEHERACRGLTWFLE